MARVLLDMDGVLCDLIGKWFAIYNQEYGDTLQLEDMAQWGPHRYAKKGKVIYRYLTQPGFFRDLNPIRGAVDGVRHLLDWGHDVVIVTAAKSGHSDKLGWVKEHLPFMDTRNMVFAHRKELVRGDVLLDDAPHNLEAFAPYGLPVAMNYRYNQGTPGERVNSWDEFLSLISSHFPTVAVLTSGAVTTERSTTSILSNGQV